MTDYSKKLEVFLSQTISNKSENLFEIDYLEYASISYSGCTFSDLRIVSLLGNIPVTKN